MQIKEAGRGKKGKPAISAWEKETLESLVMFEELLGKHKDEKTKLECVP